MCGIREELGLTLTASLPHRRQYTSLISSRAWLPEIFQNQWTFADTDLKDMHPAAIDIRKNDRQ
jgi:hypothetical protein